MVRSIGFGALGLSGIALWGLLARPPAGGLLFLQADSPQRRALWLSIGYVLLIVGIVLGVLARALLRMHDTGHETFEIRPFLGSAWRRVDLWMALFASPVLYGGLLSSFDLTPGPFAYLALQTGFSSYVVVRTVLEGKSSHPSKDAPQ